MKNIRKCQKKQPWQLPWVQGEVFNCLVLSNQQSKSQKYWVYYDLNQRKAANSYIGEASSGEILVFVFLKT